MGADGYQSKTAELAGVERKTYPNTRVFLYAYYRGVPWPVEGDAALWWHRDDWAVLTPTDGALTEVALMPIRSGLPARGAEAFPTYLEDYFAALPGGPDLKSGERASKVVASLDYPLVRRHPTPAPGLALIGDAALTTDPAPAPYAPGRCCPVSGSPTTPPRRSARRPHWIGRFAATVTPTDDLNASSSSCAPTRRPGAPTRSNACCAQRQYATP